MSKQSQNGFTLIELMITVAIVAILAAIAYPSYRQSIMRSNRTDAKVALLGYASDLEKCYTQFFKYNDYANCQAANKFNGGATLNTSNNYYKVGATFTTPPTAPGFTLTATPLGAQLNDTKCGNLTLNEQNQKGITGTSTPSSCW